MAVFVDDAKLKKMINNRKCYLSHMIASTDEELQTMAKNLGVSKDAFFKDHYKITQTLRAEALRRGAKLVSREVMLKMHNRRKITGELVEE